MSDIQELRESIHQRKLDALNRPVIEYREALGTIPAQLERELADLKGAGKAVKQAQKILQNPDYSDREDDPPAVRRAIADLRSICTGVVQTVEENPAKIEQLLARIYGRTRDHFSGWSPSTLANEDRIAANCLLGRAAALERTPPDIERLKAAVDEIVQRLLPREKQGQGHRLVDYLRAAFRKPEEKTDVKTDFEVR